MALARGQSPCRPGGHPAEATGEWLWPVGKPHCRPGGHPAEATGEWSVAEMGASGNRRVKRVSPGVLCTDTEP